MNDIINILHIYNVPTQEIDMNGLKSYCQKMCKKYGMNLFDYKTESFSLIHLKDLDFNPIMSTRYEGLYLQGIFTKEDLHWPVVRQRPRFQEVSDTKKNDKVY